MRKSKGEKIELLYMNSKKEKNFKKPKKEKIKKHKKNNKNDNRINLDNEIIIRCYNQKRRAKKTKKRKI